MIYAPYLEKNNTIGICAPSNSVTDKIKQKRLDNAIKKINDYGYKVIETPLTRINTTDKKYNKEKARELESLYLNNNIKHIICATGGDFLIEILDELNFDIIKKNIKWLQGYSDPTGLLYTITTNYDVATVYSYNACSYGMNNWHPSLSNSLDILEGKMVEQTSFDYFENEYSEYITGFEEFKKDLPVKWESLNNEKSITMHGRIIGGCLDIILNLVGTKYDNTNNFIEKYKQDGIIWYFDICDLNCDSIVRAFWQLRNCGYFKYCQGIVIGRILNEESSYNISLKEALNRSLANLGIPIIYNVDIGHKPPQLTIINGSIVTIKLTNNKGTIIHEFK